MSIPLTALQVQQQPGPLEQYGKVMQLRNLGQQQQLGQQELIGEQQKNQLQAMQLQDETKLRQLSPQFVQKDDKGTITGYDNKGFFQAAAGAGISPQRLQQIQMGQLQMTEQYAKADEATRNNEIAKNKASYEALEGIRNITDPNQRQQAYQTAIPNLQKMGVDTSKFPAQVPNNDQLQSFETGIGMHGQIIDDAKKIADINASSTNAFKEVPGTGMFFNPVTGESKTPAGSVLTPPMMESKYVQIQQSQKMGQPVSAEDKAFAQGYEKMKTLVPALNFNLQNNGATGTPGKPSAIAQGIADGSIKWSEVVSARTPMATKQALYSEVKGIKPDFNSGDASIERDVLKSATSGKIADNLTAFNTAIEHAKQLGTATDALNNGDMPTLNKIGNALGYQFGTDKMTNFNVVKNALAGEISKVFKGGGATDAEIEAVQGPFNSANSPQQLKGAIQQAISLMNSKRDALKQQVDQGRQAKPNFGENSPAAGTTRIKASDGSLHDIPTANLDGARKIDPKLTVVQ